MKRGPPERASDLGFLRADDGIRTRDPNLGKVVLYQLSHVRVAPDSLAPPRYVCGRASARIPCARRQNAAPHASLRTRSPDPA